MSNCLWIKKMASNRHLRATQPFLSKTIIGTSSSLRKFPFRTETLMISRKYQKIGAFVLVPRFFTQALLQQSYSPAARNNAESGNFHALLAHLITRLRAYVAAPEDIHAVQNALGTLFLVKIPTKHFVEHLPIDDLEVVFGSSTFPPSSAAESDFFFLVHFVF